MYKNGEELLKLAQQRGLPLSGAVLLAERELTDKSEETLRKELSAHIEVMRGSAQGALATPRPTAGDLITGIASRHARYAEGQGTLLGGDLNRAVAQAFSSSEVNASMGKICAAPTAGSCGIVPAVLFYMEKKLSADEKTMQNALLTASGVGAIYTRNATVAGAEGGCQAECGVASAMAAAAACEMAGGSPEQCMDAASFAMINVMGLVCDPVAGLVQFPCAQRNAAGTMNALLAADMALAGQKCIIPFDEVVEAMYRVGRSMPYELRETALGGVAASPTGAAYTQKIFG